MAETIALLPIEERHVESFREALDMVARERKYLIFLEAPPLDNMRSFVRYMIERGNPQIVALDGSRVVGWCDIRRLEREATAHRGVLGMGIIDGYRDRGLGRRLILAALDAARAAGMHRIELDVRSENRRAIALYEKVGFVREGVARHATLIDGAYHDSIGMALIFD